MKYRLHVRRSLSTLVRNSSAKMPVLDVERSSSSRATSSTELKEVSPSLNAVPTVRSLRRLAPRSEPNASCTEAPWLFCFRLPDVVDGVELLVVELGPDGIALRVEHELDVIVVVRLAATVAILVVELFYEELVIVEIAFLEDGAVAVEACRCRGRGSRRCRTT